jgi:hypothetical protein
MSEDRLHWNNVMSSIYVRWMSNECVAELNTQFWLDSAGPCNKICVGGWFSGPGKKGSKEAHIIDQDLSRFWLQRESLLMKGCRLRDAPCTTSMEWLGPYVSSCMHQGGNVHMRQDHACPYSVAWVDLAWCMHSLVNGRPHRSQGVLHYVIAPQRLVKQLQQLQEIKLAVWWRSPLANASTAACASPLIQHMVCSTPCSCSHDACTWSQYVDVRPGLRQAK